MARQRKVSIDEYQPGHYRLRFTPYQGWPRQNVTLGAVSYEEAEREQRRVMSEIERGMWRPETVMITALAQNRLLADLKGIPLTTWPRRLRNPQGSRSITVTMTDTEAAAIGSGLRLSLRSLGDEAESEASWVWYLAFMFRGITAEEAEARKLRPSDLSPDYWGD